jgi:hypothetical protein
MIESRLPNFDRDQRDAGRTKTKAAAILKIKKNPFALLMGWLGLLLSLMDLTTAIVAGQVLYGTKLSHHWIDYRDHPAPFVFTIVLSIGGVWLCSGLLYIIYFKKIEE